VLIAAWATTSNEAVVSTHMDYSILGLEKRLLINRVTKEVGVEARVFWYS
jgi:hypothetical protein